MFNFFKKDIQESQKYSLQKIENHNLDGLLYKDIKTGHFFLNKESKPFTQRVDHFISLFSNGVINTTTNMVVDGKYFSRVLSEKEMNLPEDGEREVDEFLLKYLFADPEHFISETPKTLEFNGNKILLHHNMVTSRDLHKYYFFDFDHATNGDILSQIVLKDNQRLERRFNFASKESPLIKPEFTQLLIKKIKKIEININNQQFMKKIIDESRLLDLGSNVWEEYLPGSNKEEKAASIHSYFRHLVTYILSKLEA